MLEEEISELRTLKWAFNRQKVGTYKFNYFYKDFPIKVNNTLGPDIIIYVPGKCSSIYPQVIYPPENEIIINNSYFYTIICLVKYNNTVKEGGVILINQGSVQHIAFSSKLYDNENGSYNISFIPPNYGKYS